MSTTRKVAVYIDGFNLYHGLRNLCLEHKQPALKWLNLRSLITKFIDPQKDKIEKIYYFSAIATHLDPAISKRHRAYIEALETVDVEFIGGNFKKKDISYKNQHVYVKLNKNEEKETDVNISITLVRDAINKTYDMAYVITNDTDIVPAIKMAKQENTELKFKLLTPPTFKSHDSLVASIKPCKTKKLTHEHIRTSLLPMKITKGNGKIIHMPSEYQS